MWLDGRAGTQANDVSTRMTILIKKQFQVFNFTYTQFSAHRFL